MMQYTYFMCIKWYIIHTTQIWYKKLITRTPCCWRQCILGGGCALRFSSKNLHLKMRWSERKKKKNWNAHDTKRFWREDIFFLRISSPAAWIKRYRLKLKETSASIYCGDWFGNLTTWLHRHDSCVTDGWLFTSPGRYGERRSGVPSTSLISRKTSTVRHIPLLWNWIVLFDKANTAVRCWYFYLWTSKENEGREGPVVGACASPRWTAWVCVCVGRREGVSCWSPSPMSVLWPERPSDHSLWSHSLQRKRKRGVVRQRHHR